MAEHTDTERLNWVIAHRPEFDDGYVRIWLGSCSSPSGMSGYHIAKGQTARDCIDQALDGNLIRID